MEQIFSKINHHSLIGIVYRKDDMTGQVQHGVDLTPEKDYLQARSIKASAGKSYKAHKHIPQPRTTELTQEAIVMVQGSMEALFYDVDDKLLGKCLLRQGDCFVALLGGHAFRVMEDDTLFYEFKNGPYNGPEKCKQFIEDSNV
jgi:hypothetical protein